MRTDRRNDHKGTSELHLGGRFRLHYSGKLGLLMGSIFSFWGGGQTGGCGKGWKRQGFLLQTQDLSAVTVVTSAGSWGEFT